MNADKIFKHGDFEAPLDLSDYRVLERWENALAAVGEKNAAIPETDRVSAQIKARIEVIAFAFDEMFGDGAANRVLGNCTSIEDALLAFSELIEFARGQSETTAAKWREIGGKYAPANREQRRAAAAKNPRK